MHDMYYNISLYCCVWKITIVVDPPPPTLGLVAHAREERYKSIVHGFMPIVCPMTSGPLNDERLCFAFTLISRTTY